MTPFVRRAFGPALIAGLLAAAPALAEDDPAIVMTPADQAGSVTLTRLVPADALARRDAGLVDRRLAAAVREVCGYTGMNGLREPAAYRRCSAAAYAGARAQVTGLAGLAAAPAVGH